MNAKVRSGVAYVIAFLTVLSAFSVLEAVPMKRWQKH